MEVDGHRFAAMAINKSAEPNSLGLYVDFAERDELIEAQPDIYYTAAHYENYPCVLVRLSRVGRDALEDLLRMAHRFVSTRHTQRRRARSRTRRRAHRSRTRSS